jgi:hypothetical protein
MNMPARTDFAWKTTLTAAALVLIGGCATTGSVLDASSRLDRSAEALHDEVRSDTSDHDLRRDAEAFADAADDFNEEVKDGADRDELRREFDKVAERYHELRDEYDDERSSNTSRRTAFAEITRAYLDLERELQYRRVAGSSD